MHAQVFSFSFFNKQERGQISIPGTYVLKHLITNVFGSLIRRIVFEFYFAVGSIREMQLELR